MEKELTLKRDEMVIRGRKYIFFMNVGKDTDLFLKYLDRKENGSRIEFISPAKDFKGKILEDCLGVYILEMDYEALIGSCLLETSSS
jgi:hypothetical protein